MSIQSSLALVLQDADRSPDLVTGALAPSAFRRAVDTWVEGGTVRRLPSSSLLLIRVDWAERPGRREAASTLRTVAELIAPVLRSSDVLGRADSETLGILMPTTGTFQAEVVSRRLRAVVSERSPGTGHAVTVSVGIASAADTSPWKKAADALRTARTEGGGDRTIVATTDADDDLQLAA